MKQDKGLFIMSDPVQPLTEASINITDIKDNNTVRFNAVLQLLDVMNGNKRIYPADLMTNHIRLAQPLIEKKQLFGEFDHPFTEDPKRVITIKLQESSHVFEKIWIEKSGNRTYVKGTLETLPNAHGYALAAMVKKGYGVGFSLRSLGRLEARGDVFYVREPFRFVTYDAVANPSNEGAFVESILNEAKELMCQRYLLEHKMISSAVKDYICFKAEQAVSKFFQ